MPRPAFTLNGAVMVQNKILGNGQPQTGSPFPPGDQRIEHAFEDIRRNAGTIVDDLKLQRQPVAFLGQRDLAQRANLPEAQADHLAGRTGPRSQVTSQDQTWFVAVAISSGRLYSGCRR